MGPLLLSWALSALALALGIARHGAAPQALPNIAQAPGLEVEARGPAAVLAETTEINILDLTGIDWEPGEALPKSVLALNGKRVLIRGYMHQSVQDETSVFPLVSDACQCSSNLLPHHFIEVDLGDEETSPIPGSFEVIGRLSVGLVEEDGFVKSVFRLRGNIY